MDYYKKYLKYKNKYIELKTQVGGLTIDSIDADGKNAYSKKRVWHTL